MEHGDTKNEIFNFLLLSFFKIFFYFFVSFVGARAAWKESAGSNAEEKCRNGAVRRQGLDLQQSERSFKYFPEILTKIFNSLSFKFLETLIKNKIKN